MKKVLFLSVITFFTILSFNVKASDSTTNTTTSSDANTTNPSVQITQPATSINQNIEKPTNSVNADNEMNGMMNSEMPEENIQEQDVIGIDANNNFSADIVDENEMNKQQEQKAAQSQNNENDLNNFQFHEIKEINFRDIEPIVLSNNPELQDILNDRFQKIIDASNYTDRTIIDELNKFREFFEKQTQIITSQYQSMKDQMVNVEQTHELYDKNLTLARWVIVIVSLGSVLLMLIIYLIWRGVVSVNKNEVEVVFAHQDIKRKFMELLDQVEALNEQINGPKKKIVTAQNSSEQKQESSTTEETKEMEEIVDPNAEKSRREDIEM
jgi:hypothetical protein